MVTALVSVESFTFNGKTVFTAYERYQKDTDGVWIWGHNTLMSNHQKASLQGTALALASLRLQH